MFMSALKKIKKSGVDKKILQRQGSFKLVGTSILFLPHGYQSLYAHNFMLRS